MNHCTKDFLSDDMPFTQVVSQNNSRPKTFEKEAKNLFKYSIHFKRYRWFIRERELLYFCDNLDVFSWILIPKMIYPIVLPTRRHILVRRLKTETRNKLYERSYFPSRRCIYSYMMNYNFKWKYF